METPDKRPWTRIAHLVDAGDAAGLEAYLETLPPSEVARSISRLEPVRQTVLLTLLTPEGAAEIIEEVPETQAGDLLSELPPALAADIVQEMESDERADVLSELESDEAEAILRSMEPGTARDVRRLLAYPADTAGGLMVTDFLSFDESQTVGEILDHLRTRGQEYSDYEIQYAYVVSPGGRLRGVLRLRDQLFAPHQTPLGALMIPDPVSIEAGASLDALREVFEQHSFIGVPVADEDGRLVGVVRRADVREAAEDQASSPRHPIAASWAGSGDVNRSGKGGARPDPLDAASGKRLRGKALGADRGAGLAVEPAAPRRGSGSDFRNGSARRPKPTLAGRGRGGRHGPRDRCRAPFWRRDGHPPPRSPPSATRPR